MSGEKEEPEETYGEKANAWVRDQDWFGHTISLNFEQNGDTYNTYIGGFVSFFLKLFLIYYVASCFIGMIFF